MERGERVTSAGASVEVQTAIAAQHEAGHIVTAAALGLSLRPEGIMVDSDAQGLACYALAPEDSDESREAMVLSTYAGYLSQKQFCEDNGYQCPHVDDMSVICSQDFQYARRVEGELSSRYLGSRGMGQVGIDLRSKATAITTQLRPIIDEVAATLLAKTPEPTRKLTSGNDWSPAPTARHLSGIEVIEILRERGITAKLLQIDNAEGEWPAFEGGRA